MSWTVENEYELAITQQELYHKHRKHRIPHYGNKLCSLPQVVVLFSYAFYKIQIQISSWNVFQKSSVI